MPRKINEGILDGLPEYISEGTLGEIPGGMNERIPVRIPDRISGGVSGEIPKGNPGRIDGGRMSKGIA